MSLLPRAGLAALLMALFLAPLAGGYPAGAAYGADLPLAALRLLVLLAGLLGGRGTAPPRRAAGLALGAAAGWTVLSLLFHSRGLTSPVLLYAMMPAALDWIAFGLVFALCRRFGADGRTRQALLLSLLGGLAWVSLQSAWEYGQYAQGGVREHRAQGPFFSPNFACGYLGLCLPLAAALFVSARQRLTALGLGALTALALGALVATGSRSGVVLAAGGLSAALAGGLYLRRGRLPWGRIAALLAAGAVLAFAFRGPLVLRVAAGGQEHSGDFRAWTQRGTRAMAGANPLLGTGPGTFPVLYPRYALVAKTDLAHHSYLQMAAEQGLPALLAAVAALLGTLVSGMRKLPDLRGEEADLLLPGLLSGLLVGMARSLFDSEWSFLGNALPFWAAAGLIAALTEPPAREASPTRAARFLPALLLLPLAAGLMQMNTFARRASALAQLQQGTPSHETAGWPPDPELLYAAQRLEDAARVEPSGRRFYQLARQHARQGEMPEALQTFRKALAADPNSLQTLRRFAEAQEASGDHAGALETWKTLIDRHEGPTGQVRAIPELPDIHPVFAYAARGDDAAARGDQATAQTFYARAADLVDEYSQTPPLYQAMEFGQVAADEVLRRREEVRALYERVIEAAPEAQKARRGDVLRRLDAFIRPDRPEDAP